MYPFSNPIAGKALSFLFYWWGKEDAERLRNLPKVMQLILSGVRVQIRQLVPVCLLPAELYCPLAITLVEESVGFQLV